MTGQRGAGSERSALVHKELIAICIFDCSCCEDVIELLLLIPILCLIVSGPLIIEHFDDGFEIAMGYMVDLHLAFALEFQGLKNCEELLPGFGNAFDSMLE